MLYMYIYSQDKPISLMKVKILQFREYWWRNLLLKHLILNKFQILRFCFFFKIILTLILYISTLQHLVPTSNGLYPSADFIACVLTGEFPVHVVAGRAGGVQRGIPGGPPCPVSLWVPPPWWGHAGARRGSKTGQTQTKTGLSHLSVCLSASCLF